MKLEIALLALAFLGAVPLQATAQSAGSLGRPLAVSWPPADWNPNQVGDDVNIPLPCGGAMAFRAVLTSGPRNANEANLLDDRRVVLGAAEEESPIAAYIRTEYVAGAFQDRDGAQYYLMGKYEVTNRQYATVMADGGQCPSSGDGSDLPKTDVSWYDAVEFTRRLNLWLHVNNAASLPRAGKQPGFVRLPTDAEWEFAARGGQAVTDIERARPTPLPVGGILDDYAWFAGGASGGGAKRPIGNLKPNPLSLYDMLGNVEEIVGDPFRMIRTGRMHGQAGAVTLRGGSYRTSAEALRSSNRTEMRLYGENGAEVKFPFVGFRLAIGAVAIGDLGSAIDLRRAWEKSMQGGNAEAGEATISKLERVIRSTNEPELQRDLREVLATMNELNEGLKKKANDVTDLKKAVDNQTSATLLALLEHALTTKAIIVTSARQLDDWQNYVDDTSSARQQRESAAAGLESEKKRFYSLMRMYSLILENLAQYPAEHADRLISSSRRVEEQYGAKARAADLETIGNLLKRYRREAGRMSEREISRAVVGEHKWLAR